MSDHTIVPADQILPARLFVVPLKGKPIFPGILTPLMLLYDAMMLPAPYRIAER